MRRPLARFSNATLVALIGALISASGAYATSYADAITVSPSTATISEGDSAAGLATGIALTSASSLPGKFLEVAVAGSTADDHLSYTTVTAATDLMTGSGEVSIFGTTVYVGDGTYARRVGEVDVAHTTDSSIRFNISTWPFLTSLSSTTGWSGWTNSTESGNAPSTFGESSLPAGMTFRSLGGWTGDASLSSETFMNTSGANVTNNTTVTTHPGRYARSLDLYLDLTPTAIPAGGLHVKGTGTLSETFSAKAGDRINYDHRNFCDSCSSTGKVNVWLGLVDTATGLFASVDTATMTQDQNWSAVYSVEVPADGTYQLALIAGGTWADGAAASRLITHVKFDVFSIQPPITTSWLANILKVVQYENTSNNVTSPITLEYRTGDVATNAVTGVGTQLVTVAGIDDPATANSAGISYDNVDTVVDLLPTRTGTFDASDPDSPIIFDSANATTVNETLSGITYTRVVVSPVGRLLFNSNTGAWAFQPNMNAINAFTTASHNEIALTANGVPFVFSIDTVLLPAPPPPPPPTPEPEPPVNVEVPEVVVPPEVVPVAPSAKSTPAASSPTASTAKTFTPPTFAELLQKAFALPALVINPGAAVANAAIGASGDDSAPPVAFDPLGSPESIAAMSGALVMAAALAGAITAATAGASAGSSGSSNAETGSADSAGEGIELDGLEAAQDELTINRQAWGDRLALFALPAFTFLDRVSSHAAVAVARWSPMLAKLFVDGAYLRAIFGSLSLIFPIATVCLAAWSVTANAGEVWPPPWPVFLLMAVIGTFDAFAGFAGAVVFISWTLLSATHTVGPTDLRMLFAVLFILMGPGLLMTAFRALRKDVEPGFNGFWERLTDFVVAPLMAGVTVSTAVLVIPALGGLTYPVANHVADFGLFVAVAASLRVLIEELAAKSFPQRLNAINPSSIPSPPLGQQFFALIVSYGLWVFLTGAITGTTWQVFVGSAFFVLPTLLAMFSDSYPNSVWIWRIMPQGVPGLIFTLMVAAASSIVLMNITGANPDFAAWNMFFLPLPMLALAVLAMFGRHGATDDEPRFVQRFPIVFRVGGVVMFVVALRAMAII
jgi:hypothetical protein